LVQITKLTLSQELKNGEGSIKIRSRKSMNIWLLKAFAISLWRPLRSFGTQAPSVPVPASVDGGYPAASAGGWVGLLTYPLVIFHSPSQVHTSWDRRDAATWRHLDLSSTPRCRVVDLAASLHLDRLFFLRNPPVPPALRSASRPF
jgi:hypothetical protein